MSLVSRARVSRVLCVAAAIACQEPVEAPPLAFVLTAAPPAQVAGNVITLTSPQFDEFALIPRADSQPYRWANFAITVGDDTADSWRVDPDEIAFRVPPLITGNHEAVVRHEGRDPARVGFFGVGLAFPPYARLHAYTNVFSGTPLPPDGVLIGETDPWPGFSTGYGLLDASTRTLRMFPPLAERVGGRIKMYAPGPSYRANHFVFDLSTFGVTSPTVWSVDPLVQLVDSLPCRDPSGWYTAAELGPGTCVILQTGQALVRNAADTILWEPALTNGQFRMATGGRWTVIRTSLFLRPRGFLSMHWPVLDQLGNLAYTIDTLSDVTGAAFSQNGDTLYAAVAVRDTTFPPPNLVGGRFSLVVLETATGRTLSSRAFSPARYLQDVALDPARPLLYVAGAEERPFPRPAVQYLTVLDRQTLEIIADIPATVLFGPFGDAVLVHNGSAGRVSLFAHCGFDCGGLWVFTYDLP